MAARHGAARVTAGRDTPSSEYEGGGGRPTVGVPECTEGASQRGDNRRATWQTADPLIINESGRRAGRRTSIDRETSAR